MRKNESGATIVVVISIIATLAVFIGAALDYTFTVGKNVNRSNQMAAAAAIANGCLNYEFMYWRELCRDSSTAGPPTSTFANIPLPTSSQFPNVSGFNCTTGTSPSYTVSNFGVTGLTPQLAVVSTGTALTPGITVTGTNRTYFYRGWATVNLPARGQPIAFNCYQIFMEQYQNPWEWALFFQNNLEIEPGANMTVDGWVQTNAALYTPNNLLTFGNRANYGTNWYISPMPGDSHLGYTNYTDPNWPSNLPPSQLVPSQPFGLNATDLFAVNNDNTNDGYHELVEPPDPNNADPLSSYRYFDQAGVKIMLNESGSTITATIYDNSTQPTVTNGSTVLGTTIGKVVYTPASGKTAASTVVTSSSGNTTYQTSLLNTFSNALTFNQNIQDNREGQTVGVTELNVSTIYNAFTNNTLSDSAGASNYFYPVVYLYDAGGLSSTSENGFELINGSKLPTGGLTVASDNPVYVQGDYNTGTSPPSNTNSSNSNIASGYTWQPASVVADSVNILSNAWTNSESTSSLSSRNATNTTINAAILSGNVPTASGNYSGGAENFPRFLENWGSATFTYYGSMVELYPSATATHVWGSSNVYDPPTRAWNYDTNFQYHPPPGTIMVVGYLKGQWYQL